MNTNLKLLLLCAASVAVVSCSQKKNAQDADAQVQEQPQVTNVEVSIASFRDVPQNETYATTVQAYVTNNVVPQTGARIKKINVEVGDFVRAGQVLAEMDQVNLQQTRLKLANDSTELARLRSLFLEGGLSRSDFESMELAYKVSRTQYENLLENTILRSPISGVITARNYDKGDMFAMAQPIFTVQQITPVKLLVAISETDYTKVGKGDRVSIEADALPGRTFEGRVNRIYPTIDPATHTFTVEVLVQNNDRALRPGMYARANVTFAVNHSIVVPDAAVVKQQGSGQRSVFVVNPDRTVTSRVVTLGRHFGSEFEILEGLAEGDEVVVKGITALKNGSLVNVL